MTTHKIKHRGRPAKYLPGTPLVQITRLVPAPCVNMIDEFIQECRIEFIAKPPRTVSAEPKP